MRPPIQHRQTSLVRGFRTAMQQQVLAMVRNVICHSTGFIAMSTVESASQP
jgi:hypothetical protein